MFFEESKWLEQACKRITKGTFLQNYMENGPMVSDKKIFKVFYIDNYIGKISPAPWRPCFLTNPNGLNNLGRRSPKEHFCKIILKSVQWFWTRRLFKFLIKKSIFSSCDLDMQWTGTIWTTLKEDQPRIIPVKFGQIPTSGLGGDVV